MDTLHANVCHECGVLTVVVFSNDDMQDYICKECSPVCWVHDTKIIGAECTCCYGIELIQTTWRKYLARRECNTMSDKY